MNFRRHMARVVLAEIGRPYVTGQRGQLGQTITQTGTAVINDTCRSALQVRACLMD